MGERTAKTCGLSRRCKNYEKSHNLVVVMESVVEVVGSIDVVVVVGVVVVVTGVEGSGVVVINTSGSCLKRIIIIIVQSCSYTPHFNWQRALTFSRSSSQSRVIHAPL